MMINLLKRVFGKNAPSKKEWEQRQREAIIDLVLFGMYADHLLSLAENQFLEDEVDELDWEAPISCVAYLSTAIHRVRDIEGSAEKRTAFLQSIRERLGDETGRQGALLVLEDLFASDGKAREEQAVLDEIRAIFEKGA